MTGASGFVGRILCGRLAAPVTVSFGAEDWRSRLARVDFRDASVFHLAARAHVSDTSRALADADNVEKTRALAEAAAAGGASRFVYLSTIKVHGEETTDRPFAPADVPAPQGPYAQSKWRAEQALAEVGRATGLKFTIVRAPLVVGADPRGNLLALMRLCDSPWPLPFAGIRNRRTLVCVEDLAALLELAAVSDAAADRILLAGDPRPISTPRLVQAVRAAWDRPAHLFPFPSRLLEGGASLVGRGQDALRLTRSLEIDVAETQRLLGWSPQFPIEEGLARMARAYREGRA